MSEEVTIRSASTADAMAVARIYNHYVGETPVTFEEEVVSESEIARRIEEVGSASLPWLIAEQGASVLGYAYATRWRSRSAYRFSVEIAVYLDPVQPRRGIGSRIYGELLPMLRSRSIRSAIGGIALPNDASVALHEKFGFLKVAHFREVGFKFDQWIDVGYWQRNF